MAKNDLNSRTVLVVDDDNRLRALLQKFLSENGFRVFSAADAREADALRKWFVFDLMVVDVMMPGESGIDYVKRLRNEKDSVPVLMLTAMGETENRIEADLVRYMGENHMHPEIWVEHIALEGGLIVKAHIHWGDWKHDHLRYGYLIGQWAEAHGFQVIVPDGVDEVTEEDGTDSYSGIHRCTMYRRDPEALALGA